MTRICSIHGCRGKHKARGYCSTHYRQWKRTGSPGSTVQASCTVAGCSRAHHGRGLCKTHYEAARLGLSTAPV